MVRNLSLNMVGRPHNSGSHFYEKYELKTAAIAVMASIACNHLLRGSIVTYAMFQTFTFELHKHPKNIPLVGSSGIITFLLIIIT